MSTHTMPWLSLVIWLPIIGGAVVLFLGDKDAARVRWASLIFAVLTFIVSLPLYARFDITTAEMQFVQWVPWIPQLNINYYLGVDGFSMPFIVLTSLITVIVVISGWAISYRIHQYFAAFLFMAGFMNGVFAALDAVLFYIFFEAMLIPMFLIIGIWGGAQRILAAVKFFLYTFSGSIFILIAIIYLHIQTEGSSFNILDFQKIPLSIFEQKWLFLALLAGFAVKVPMWPVHTWLPSAHVEAPTGGSVILAAITLKIGGYGFVRFILPIVPEGVAYFSWLVIALSVIAIVYISLVALAQTDMKKTIAYSSIAHMGFVTLAFMLPIAIRGSEMKAAHQMALQGGMMQMISHGFVSAAIFLSIGVLYDRVHSRKIADYGGVLNTMPIFGAFFIFFAMANAGLPGTSGFVGEFWVLIASFHYGIYTIIAVATSLILSAAYNLWLVKRVILGAVVHQQIQELKDINPREYFVLAVLAFFIILLGIWPAPLANIMQASIDHLLNQLPTVSGQL